MALINSSQVMIDMYQQNSAAYAVPGVIGNRFLEQSVYANVAVASTEVLGVSYESTQISGRSALWIQPDGATHNQIILFLHGGGFTVGTIDESHRKLAAHIAKSSLTTTLSFDYSLAPEYPFPAPMNDVLTVYKELLHRGYKPQHIVLAGDSSGARLATSLCIQARDQGLPQPVSVVSLSPWYDLTISGDSVTYNLGNGRDAMNSRGFLEFQSARVIANTTLKLEDPLVSPLFANVSGLAPYWISTGGFDMLTGDAERMTEEVKQASVEVVLEVAEGQQHVFEFAAGRSDAATASIAKVGEWIKRKLGGSKC